MLALGLLPLMVKLRSLQYGLKKGLQQHIFHNTLFVVLFLENADERFF